MQTGTIQKETLTLIYIVQHVLDSTRTYVLTTWAVSLLNVKVS